MLDPYGRRIEVSLSIRLDILIVWPEVPHIIVARKLASKIGSKEMLWCMKSQETNFACINVSLKGIE